MADEWGEDAPYSPEQVTGDGEGAEPSHVKARGRKKGGGGLFGRRQPPVVDFGYQNSSRESRSYLGDPDPWAIEDQGDSWAREFSDDLYASETQPDSTPARDPRPFRRRHHRKPGRGILAAGAALATAGLAAGTIAVTSGGGGSSGGEHPKAHTSISAPRTPEKHVYPELASLQKAYENSHAVFQTGGDPFAIGLTPPEHARLQHLYKELKSNKYLSSAELEEYGTLNRKEMFTAPEVEAAQHYIKEYDARFMGKTELSTGQKLNFYIVNNAGGETVNIDARALDAYGQWMIAQYGNLYQQDGTSEDSVREEKIAAYQKQAKAGKLDNVYTILINPTQNDCFTKNGEIVWYQRQKTKEVTVNGEVATKVKSWQNRNCHELGFEETPVAGEASMSSGIVAITSVGELNTRATLDNPNDKGQIWVKGNKATSAVLMHELLGHGGAGAMDLFGKDDKADHLQFTVPLTNLFIRTVNRFSPSELPPLPITISKN